jgi:hypothetical protein
MFGAKVNYPALTDGVSGEGMNGLSLSYYSTVFLSSSFGKHYIIEG